MSADTTLPQPTTMQQLASAVYPSFAMLAGMQLDVFTPLKDDPLKAAQLADVLGVNMEKLSRLLYALVTAGLLTVDGDRFANTPEAQQFLVKGQPTYLGGRHETFSEVWENLLHTAETIRTGVPQCKTVGFNVVFLNIFDDGRAYTEGEHRTWLMAAGFAETARVPLPEGVSIMTARKHV